MKKTVVIYGLLGGILIAGLKAIEYRYLVLQHSLEIYGGLVAVLFAAVGIGLGRRSSPPRETIVTREVRVPVEVQVPVEVRVPVEVQVPVRVEVPVPMVVPFQASATGPFKRDEARREQLGITARELEILELIAEGLSNREIAGRLFVSENTVKTHAGRLFDKLDARRRTQAVQRAKEARLIA
jgi:DNA-binding CsgD family transcriptional regulator